METAHISFGEGWLRREKMVRICVADSNAAGADKICNLLEKELDTRRISYSIDKAVLWSDVDKAVKAANTYQMFVICIDSLHPTFDWRRLSSDIRDAKNLCKIVYVSDRLEDAEEVFEYFPYSFVYRPNLEYRLPQFIDRACNGLHIGRRKVFTTKLVQYAVNYDDILFCEHVQRKTQVVCEKFVITINEKLVNVLEELPSEFIQTHSSFIVNMNHVRGFGKNGCTMDNGTVVPVSRSRYVQTLEAFEKYISAAGD